MTIHANPEGALQWLRKKAMVEDYEENSDPAQGVEFNHSGAKNPLAFAPSSFAISSFNRVSLCSTKMALRPTNRRSKISMEAVRFVRQAPRRIASREPWRYRM
jgi:hypothetical protein